MKVFTFCILLSGLLILAGCQSTGNQAGETAVNTNIPSQESSLPVPSLEATVTNDKPFEPSDLAPETQALIQRAKERVSQKFHIPLENLSLFSIEPVIWPDTSLGCPQPGVQSSSISTPGYQILFEAEQQTFLVHTDQNESIIICTVRPPGEIYLKP